MNGKKARKIRKEVYNKYKGYNIVDKDIKYFYNTLKKKIKKGG
jgi:hypothetical protein